MSNATDIRQSGGTAGSVDHTDTGLAVSRTIPMPPTDTLYRAALTFCLDGADVMMYATLKGAESAESLWHALAQSHPSQPSEICGPALSRIDRMFVDGLTRWGRKASANAMRSFRNALAGWHNRMMDLPSQDIIQLADWFTMDGTQWIIGPGHPCWPSQLADLSIRSDWAPPLCLWIKGDPRALTSCAKPVGIVGSRDVTEYGRYVAHTVAEQAAVAGHLVVSGGAMGTDAAAHWGALNALHGRMPANVGRTVAVFAGGLNHIGPMRNRTLFERIEAQGGALISELCPGTIPEARRFLLRNRIIAAMSSTLIVTQARLRSGALNTAGWACELLREVYAVPGDINQPCNAGCNKMIGDHRAMILCAATSTEDICHERHKPVMGVCPGISKSTGQDSSENEEAMEVPATTPLSPASSESSASQESSQDPGHSKRLRTKHTQPTLVQSKDGPASATAETGANKSKGEEPPSSHQMPDLRVKPKPDPEKEAQQRIIIAKLPEMERTLVALIRECRKRHLIVTPDALLRVARETVPDEIPNIGTILELLGALELRGVIERDAGILKLSSRVG